jgi:hypothetical protein
MPSYFVVENVGGILLGDARNVSEIYGLKNRRATYDHRRI